MAKKKILFLITKATWGGAQRYVYDLAAHLPRDRFEPVVAYGEGGRLSKMLAEKGIETHQIPALGRDIALISDVSSFFQLLVCLWRVRPDVMHLNSSKAAALGALAARIIRVPKIVFTAHGWPFKENRNIVSRAIIYLISWFTALLSDAVIVVSKEDEALGKKMSGVAKKIHYVPIGIEPPQFLSREEARRALAYDLDIPGGPKVVTIAELTPNKGIRYGIEAMVSGEYPAWKTYMIIGDGEESESLRQLGNEYAYTGSVFPDFVGFKQGAAKYLKAFDVFLLPSIKEGMPYVLLEAALAGLPIVTTTAISPEVLEGYENIVRIKPADPKAIVEAIRKVVSDYDYPGGTSVTPQNDFVLTTMLEKTTALY